VRGGSLRFLATVPGYAANFRRMGLGHFDTIARRITEYRTAGADQVVVQLEGLPHGWSRRLAEAVR
jgi:hypothetical protein